MRHDGNLLQLETRKSIKILVLRSSFKSQPHRRIRVHEISEKVVESDIKDGTLS